MNPDVTVCIPVYKAEAFVRAAIESVLSQTYDRFTLLISVDPSEDRSAEICREYIGDPRVAVVENPTRLGWVGNVNACLDLVATPFFAVCFHDDALEPIFLERLRAALAASPNAVAAFGALQRFGTMDEIARPGDVVGTPAFRAKACMNGIFPAYGLKNLMRSDPVLRGLRLASIGDEGFVADLPFALAYSLAGDFVAVPDLVYRKMHHTGSVTAGWREFDVERLAQNLILLRLHLIRVVQAAGLELKDRQELVQLILNKQGSQKPSTTKDMHHLADALDLLSPTLLIAELLDPNPEPIYQFADLIGQRAEHAKSRLKLARNFKRIGGLKAARSYAEQALRLDDQAIEVHCLLARLGLNDNEIANNAAEIERAHDHARMATELDKENPVAWLLLARAQAKLEDWAAVKHSSEMALALGLPDSERANKLLARAQHCLGSKGFLGFRW